MVETREREVIYATQAQDSPSTAIVVMFSLLILAVLGFGIYYFANNSAALNAPATVIERNTNTTTTLPTPVQVPTPNINITAPAPAASAPSSGSSDSGSSSSQ